MRVTGWLVLASAILCLGAWLIATGWAQPRPTVSQAIRHLRRSGAEPEFSAHVLTNVVAPLAFGSPRGEHGGTWVGREAAGFLSRSTRRA